MVRRGTKKSRGVGVAQSWNRPGPIRGPGSYRRLIAESGKRTWEARWGEFRSSGGTEKGGDGIFKGVRI